MFPPSLVKLCVSQGVRIPTIHVFVIPSELQIPMWPINGRTHVIYAELERIVESLASRQAWSAKKMEIITDGSPGESSSILLTTIGSGDHTIQYG